MASKLSPRQSGKVSRPAMWKLIRELREGITIAEIGKRTSLEVQTITGYLRGLTAAGYLTRHPAERFQPVRFDLVKDIGVEAPRVREDGTAVTEGAAREQMWRTMKAIGSFTALQLSVEASLPDSPVKQIDAADYCKWLEKAGYLAVVHAAKGGAARTATVFRFLASRNTGPHAPAIRRVVGVYDMNEEVRVFAEEPKW